MIPPKILEEIEAAAEKEFGKLPTSRNEAYKAGLTKGFQIAQEIYAPLVEALEESIQAVAFAKHKIVCMDAGRHKKDCKWCESANWLNTVEHQDRKALSDLAERLGEP